MAPTICSEKESARVRNVRELRKRFHQQQQQLQQNHPLNISSTSSSSVISYAGKITHRRSIAIRSAKSNVTALRKYIDTIESTDDEETDSNYANQNELDNRSAVAGSPSSIPLANDNSCDENLSTMSDNSSPLPANCNHFIAPASPFTNINTRNILQHRAIRNVTDRQICQCSENFNEKSSDEIELCDKCNLKRNFNSVIVHVRDQRYQNIVEQFSDNTSASTSTTKSSIWDENSMNSMDSDTKNHEKIEQKNNNSKGLLEIAVKTVKLIKRNQLLQRKLAELQLETRAFVQSVLANPENQGLREKLAINNSKACIKSEILCNATVKLPTIHSSVEPMT